MCINIETKLQTENILALTVAKFDMVPYFVISVRDVPGEVPTSIPTQDKVAATRQDIYQEQLAQACVVFFFRSCGLCSFMVVFMHAGLSSFVFFHSDILISLLLQDR